MRIFQILLRNTGQKARTLAPGTLAAPAGYRGTLQHDTSLCTGCGTCAYVCSPGAIRLEKQPAGVLWQYQAVQCTFCARCAEYCPTKAIQLEDAPHQTALAAVPESAPLASSGPLETRHMIDYQPCERCGQPFVPLPAPVLARLSGGAVDPGMSSMMRLCEKCRSRVTSQRLKESFVGVPRKEGR